MLRLWGQVGVHKDLAQMVNPRVEWLDPDAEPETWHYARMLPVYRATGTLCGVSCGSSKIVPSASSR